MSIHTILTNYEVFLIVIFVKDLEKQSIHLEESNHCFSIVLEIRLLNEGFLNALARFIRLILVASNAIKTIRIDNEMINLVKLHYLLFELHSTRPKFDV
jgi:hypothetical protein